MRTPHLFRARHPSLPRSPFRSALLAGLLAGLLGQSPLAPAALTDISQAPISSASSINIKPNIVFILDDSLSMDWDYLPDWADVNRVDLMYQFFNPNFNGLAYNPATEYVPPSYVDTTTYPSQNKANTNNWTQVKRDGYGVQFTGLPPTVDLTGASHFTNSAFYYTTQAGEFCTDRTLKNCAAAKDATHTFEAKLRWCDTPENAALETPAANSCQAIMIEKVDGNSIKFTSSRLPAPKIAQLHVITAGAIDRITVAEPDGNVQIMNASLALGSAANIAAEINKCTYKKTGLCQATGYIAKVTGNDVFIFAPRALAPDTTPVVNMAGVYTVSKFAAPSDNKAPGVTLLTVIEPGRAAYPKAPSRTDCTGTHPDMGCSYEEEMTNYANWYAYYRTRMQAMKTAASRAFQPIDDTYRIGYFSINNNTESDFQNIADFTITQKQQWLDKLFAATPGKDTPLRAALSKAGYLYAGKYNNTKFQGETVVDPMQMYCQPAVAILSSDGYWTEMKVNNNVNAEKGFTLTSVNTLVDDQDGPNVVPEVLRPQLDAGSGKRLKREEQWMKKLAPQEENFTQKATQQWRVQQNQWRQQLFNKQAYATSRLEKRSYNYYVREYQLQTKTAVLYNEILKVTYTKETSNLRATRQQQTYRDYQLQKQVNGAMRRLTAKLQKQVETKRKLVKQLKKTGTQVYMSTDYGATYNKAESCSTTGASDAVQCKTEPIEENPAASCTYGNAAKKPDLTEEDIGDGKIRKTYYTTTKCEYVQVSNNVLPAETSCVNVPAATTSTDHGAVYTPAQTVACSRYSLGSWTNTGNCIPDAAAGVSCKYSTFVDMGEDATCTAESKPTEITPSYVAGNPLPAGTAYETSEWHKCSGGWGDPVDAPQCKPDANTRCSYTLESSGDWKGPGACVAKNQTPSSSTGAFEPNPHECGTRNLTNATNESTCQIGNVDGVITTACDYPSVNNRQTNLATCTESGGYNSDTGIYSGPEVTCVPTSSWEIDTVHTSCDPDEPESATNRCKAHWQSVWTNTGSCTPTVSSEIANPSAGAVTCRYSNSRNFYNPTCEAVSQPTITAGTEITVGVARTCDNGYWGSYGYVPAGGTCVDDTYNDCRYTTWSATTFAACPADAKAQSTGPTYNVVTATKCWKEPGTTKPVDTPTCEDIPGVQECYKVEKVPFTDDTTYDPEEHEHHNCNEAHPLTVYQKFLVGKSLTTTDPLGFFPVPPEKATETNPSPTGETCVEGLVNGLETSCRKAKAEPSDEFAVPSCTEAEKANGGFLDSNGVLVTCRNAKNGEWSEVTSCTEQLPTKENGYHGIYCTVTSDGQTPDTLADVAMYYQRTDLRTTALGNCAGSLSGEDVCRNDAPLTDPKKRQFMQTYTLGLGVSGVMQYDPNYRAVPEHTDFHSIYHGTNADPATGVCSWQEVGPCNWPKPVKEKQTTIDDLWHTAVNGEGMYFSAKNPADVATSISSALQEVVAKDGSRAPAEFVNTDDLGGSVQFIASFTSGNWAGDVKSYKPTLDSNNAPVRDENGKQEYTEVWSARSQLNALAHTARKIHYFSASESGHLKPFAWSGMTPAEKANFELAHITGSDSSTPLSQFCASGISCLPAAAQADAAGEKLVDFLRGDSSYEGGPSDLTLYFRQRAAKLGDIVSSGPTYVQAPMRSYNDNGYSAFRTALTSGSGKRKGMVYVGANDGMLHAFNATDGKEEWAFIPSFLMPDLYRLADKYYAHRYYVDGTPVVGDICVANCGPGVASPEWKTILVGGVNLGGRGYYALDITDPDDPKGLWEFSSADNANLGYTFGNPVIAKLGDGTWAVFVTSGYNNVPEGGVGTGDGQGHLFVLNAATGALIRDIPTGVGSPGSPSGLAKIAPWVNYAGYNDTAAQVYGGDLEGNVWRFDINGTLPPEGFEAQRLATLKDAGGRAQPITTVPELGLIASHKVVFVGTGQLLGMSDMTNTNVQSLYAIKDRGTQYDHGNPRAPNPESSFVEQTQTLGICPAGHPYCEEGETITTGSKNEVDWATKDGWYTDFPRGGERFNTNFLLTEGTLTFKTNTPQSGACVPAGKSSTYFMDYRTGGFIESDNCVGNVCVTGRDSDDFLATDITGGVSKDGTPVFGGSGDTSSAADTDEIPIDLTGGGARRVSWRELVIE